MTERTKAQREFEHWSTYPDSVDDCVRLVNAAMARSEEIAVESNRRHDAATVLFDTLFSRGEAMEVRLSALESAAREPATTEADDPLCANPECGHPRSDHTNFGVCFKLNTAGAKSTVTGKTWHFCPCNEFVPPSSPPAPVVDPVCGCNGNCDGSCEQAENLMFARMAGAQTSPLPAVDPVLFHIAEAARLISDDLSLYGLELVFLDRQGRDYAEDARDEMLAYGLKP